MPARPMIERCVERALTGLFVLFALAGCAETAPPVAVEPSPAAAQGPDTAGNSPASVRESPPLSVALAKSSMVTASMKAASSGPMQTAVVPLTPPPDPVSDNPKQLFGLSGPRVTALLGPANYVRRDGSAEVWQYQATACVLDVFLYRRDATLFVAHFDLRQRSAATEPPRHCYGGLLARSKSSYP